MTMPPTPHAAKPAEINPHSIALHDSQSDHYRFRTPYNPALFERVCCDLGVSRTSVLVDFGCGQGEVTRLLAPYAGKVYGVDGSAAMIALATPMENTAYQVVDLNRDNPVICQRAKGFFFGRSIHWFPGTTLKRLSDHCLEDSGAIVVCSSQWKPVGPWGSIYQAIKNQYIPYRSKADVDFSGVSNLQLAGFVAKNQYSTRTVSLIDVDFLIGHTYSAAYGDQLTALKTASTAFRHDMYDHLSSFADAHALAWEVKTWAIVYRSAD